MTATATTPKRKADEITKDVVEETITDGNKVLAVNVNVTQDEAQVPVSQVVVVVPVAEEVAAAAVAAADTDAAMAIDVDGGDDDDPSSASKRRFFPRVKHLLTPEWEPFLVGVLDALEDAGAPSSAAASHKESNAWYKAFNTIYNGVARDCSIPHGKNRYHKFKDKIVELWQGVESYTGDDLPLKERALAQYEEYRKACASQASTPKKEGGYATMVPPKTPGSVMTMTTPRVALDKGSSRRATFSAAALKWKHLDEAVALASLPEPLKRFLNLRHVGQELGATANATAIKEQYDKALGEYLKDVPEGKDALYEKSMALAFLCRFSFSSDEVKDITETYERVVSAYVNAINESFVISV